MISSREIQNMQKNMVCLHTQQEVEVAIDRVAEAMNQTFSADDLPIFLCTMNGAVIFMGQLLPRLRFPLQIDYVHTARYYGTMHAGDLHWIAKPTTSLQDRIIVIVEDIIDSGITLARVIDYCEQQGAKKIYTAALVDKEHERSENGIETVDFAGLHVEDKFLLGYGLDYQGFFRNLPGIYAVQKPEGRE
ncbi:MAG: hypoxanthine-guanine phosphoribosyltransferase [Gammaproteobacteria bacterium]|nr:hypoxanthine-guanine phosphoribosyltransferase [Gammaproteobacteria bacterium]